MARAQGFCIFCGGAGLSKEHIFPQWMHDYLPKYERTGGYGQRVHADEGPWHHKIIEIEDVGSPLRGARPVHTQQLRIVCKTCNNGWMSLLQQKAQTLLTKTFLKGQAGWRRLRPDEQRVLASWAAMFVIVLEFCDHSTRVTTVDQRRFLMEHRAPPRFWNVWVGLFERQDTLLFHEDYQEKVYGEAPKSADEARVAQITAFVAGGPLFLTLSSTKLLLGDRIQRLGELARRYQLRRLWPARMMFEKHCPAVVTGVLWDSLTRDCRDVMYEVRPFVEPL